jgi:hypothetical protein
MPSKSQLDLIKKDATARVAAANRRNKNNNMTAMFIRKGSLVSTSALYGTLNRFGVPITLGGFPWKIGIATISLLVEGLTKGAVQSIAAGVNDSTTAIYIERAISTGSVIAGDDDEDGGEI